MANFNLETEYFLDVLKSAINKTELAPPSEELDWELLFDYAEKQDVFGILADTIPKQYLSNETRVKLNNYEKSQIVHMVAMNNELKLIENELEKLEIKYMLLKGAVIRNFYPKQIMRQMGDFDIMYDIKDQDKLIKMMTDRGYELTSDGGNSDDFNKKPFYTFEFHHDLFKDAYGFCPDFSFVWNRANNENGIKHNMAIEDVYLHSLAHMYKHFVFGGFGIRFIIDNYLIIKQFKDSLDEEYISMRIEEMQLEDFRKTVDSFSISFFEGELTPEQVAFAKERLLVGVYGSHIENVEEIYKRFQNGNGKKSIFSFILKRIFPSKNQMISNYPSLKDKPYLLPWYYVVRIFTKSTNGVKKVINEIKSINKIGDK